MLKLLVLTYIASVAAFAPDRAFSRPTSLSIATATSEGCEGPSNMIGLHDDNFQHVLQNNKAVLVDVCAKWCGPCKLLIPVLERAHDRWGDVVTQAKYDINHQNSVNLKMELVIQQVMPKKLPSLILFHNGKALASRTGVLNDQQLDNFLEEHLGASIKNEEAQEADQQQAGYVSFARNDGSSGGDDYMLSA